MEAPEKYEALLSPSELEAYAINLAKQGGYKDRPPTVYSARAVGRHHCLTEGSDHYHNERGPEAMDLLISCGLAESYCLGAAIMYVTRYRRTRDLNDLVKAVDMLHILCGVELTKQPASRE